MFYNLRRQEALGSLNPRRGGVPTCPQCRKAVAVQRVRTLIAKYSSTGHEPSVCGSIIAGRRTPAHHRLATLLRPPPQPIYQGIFVSADPQCRAERPGDLHTHVVAWELLALSFSGLLLLIGARAAGLLPFGGIVTLWLLARLALCGLLTLSIVLYDRRQVTKARALRTQWRQAIERWESLHYCAHCDGVFVPHRASFARAQHTYEYLYRGDTSFQLDGADAWRQEYEWSN